MPDATVMVRMPPDGFAGLWYAIGRHRRGHDPLGGGGPFGGRGGRGGFGDFGDDGMPRGRQFSSDDLQLLLLALVAEQPSHGYELIKALDTRSNGLQPGPGMVYPALTYLEEVGFVASQAEGNRKRYALTDAGARISTRSANASTRCSRVSRTSPARWNSCAARSPGNRRATKRRTSRSRLAAGVRRGAPRTQAGAAVKKSAADADEQRRIAAIMPRDG